MRKGEKERKKCDRATITSMIAICVAILFVAVNTAALVMEKDIETLTKKADTIVIGNVTDIQSQWEKGKIFYVTKKGMTEPAVMKGVHEVFNLSEAEWIITSEEAATLENESKPITDESENNVTISSPGWVTILREDFEHDWPSGKWSRSGIYPCEYTWDKDDYAHYTGRYSAWCAGVSLGGCRDLDPANDYYPDNMDAWMIYGPFDLSDATDAKMTFYFRGRTEFDYDWFSYGKSSDRVHWSGYSLSGSWRYGPYTGNDGRKWYREELSLQDLCGDSTVWIGFEFYSDYSVGYEGIFVDNVTIEKYVPTTLRVSVSETPDPVDPGGTSQVTVHVTSSDDGLPVQGARVTVSATCGSVTPTSGITDSNGDFKATYHAPTYPTTCTISATASKTGYNSGSGSDTITVVPGEGNVSFDQSKVRVGLHSTKTVNITLDKAPNDLSGYNITISLSNPSVAEIVSVSFPS